MRSLLWAAEHGLNKWGVALRDQKDLQAHEIESTANKPVRLFGVHTLVWELGHPGKARAAVVALSGAEEALCSGERMLPSRASRFIGQIHSRKILN